MPFRKKRDKIFYGLLTSSIFFIVIGLVTTTYNDTALLNSEPIGILQTIAGVVGIMHCYKWIDNAKMVAYIVQLSIVFRITSYIAEIVAVGYRPGLVVGALIWTLIWAGYFVTNALIAGIVELQESASNKPPLIVPVEGFEPTSTEPKSVVLPLNDTGSGTE